jgi:hypothetical protein
MMVKKWSGPVWLSMFGLVAGAWAYCPEEKKSESGSAETAKSGHGCQHGAGEATKAADAATGEKPGGCCAKKGSAAGLASEKSGGCAKNCRLRSPAAETQNAVDAVLAALPSMQYRVGTETTSCVMSAEQMAIKHDKPVQYVVGEKAFENKMEATVALAALLESEIANLTSVQYSVNGKATRCPHEAKEVSTQNGAAVTYRVGGQECPDKAKAEQAAKLASEAVATVKLSYKVGDESFCCDKMAGTKARESGKKLTYVVGTEETCCEQSAKLLLAQAKIRAIVETTLATINS